MKNSLNDYLHPKILSFLCLPFFFLHHLTLPAGAVTGDDILLNCGSSGSTSNLDDRTWIGDINNKYSPLQQQSNNNSSTSSSSVVSTSPSVQEVPYLTARLSHSQFTYSIPVTPGEKFIRFYFYPAQYPDFNRSEAFFSIRTGPYTLLSNFSASLAADASGLTTIYREFCINVDDQGEEPTLNITFTPSPDSYAFINGIEIVSMPTNLYYSATNDVGVQMVETKNQRLLIEKSRALGLVYRINVGGTYIDANKDTGMSRIWSTDNQYLTPEGEAFSVLPVNTTIQLSFTRIPNYSAPEDLYRTARTMGTDKTINKIYNLTWEFPVDSDFTYLVRLHFCEFQIEFTKVHDREFLIFIANQTAEDQADVIKWTGGSGIPIYRDYAVMMAKRGTVKKQNLSIALHPSLVWKTLYSDAILNGLEIFKLSNDGNLAGPNPDPDPPLSIPSSDKPISPSRTPVAIIAATTGGVAAIVALSLLCFFIFRRRRLRLDLKLKDTHSSDGASLWGPFSMSTTTKSTKSHGSSLPSDLCRHFSLAEIKVATNNFDKVFIIGAGGFGNVYKGVIDDGATEVAIKRLNPGSKQGAHEFLTEIEMLSRLRHLHLVSLIGYCEDENEMILVYDYMSRGTIRDHLYNTDNPPLSWSQRLKICIGAARGLQYLHTGAKQSIIHRDVKTTNILLDDKWVAKVSDFGLSRTGSTSMSKAHVSTIVKGSFGYLDPEYYRRQQLTEKSDVYSFGVVLCEVLCARPPLNRTVERKQVSLAEWARNCYRNGTFDQIIDPNLKGKIAPECLKKYSEIAISCLHDNGIERPSMSDVVWSLEFVLQLQKTAEEGIKIDGALDQIDNHEIIFEASSVDNHDHSYKTDSKSSGVTMGSNSSDQSFSVKSCTDEGLTSKTVFSEIMNPTGR